MGCRVTIVVWCHPIVCMPWAVITIIGNKIITTAINPFTHVNSKQQGSTLSIQTLTITITTYHFVPMGRHKESTVSIISNR